MARFPDSRIAAVRRLPGLALPVRQAPCAQ